MQKSKIKPKRGRKSKPEFPRMPIEESVKLIERAKEKYGGLISHKELAMLKFHRAESIRGGAFGQLVKSLKSWALMKRSGLSQLTITDVGYDIINEKDEKRRKQLMFNQFLKMPIFKELFDTYRKGGLPRAKRTLAERIFEKYEIKRQDAARLAGLFTADFEFFDDMRSAQVPEDIESAPILPAETTLPTRPTTPPSQISELAEFIGLIQQLFPSGEIIEKDAKNALNRLIELARNYKFETFSEYLESVQSAYKDLKSSELMGELKRDAKIAIDIFKKDLKKEKPKP